MGIYRRLNDLTLRAADRVSYAMGSPLNIVAWLVALVVWVALGPYMARHAFLPDWFTSNGFNFPLNTVTTVAELFIGFLVGAAANRVQRATDAQSQAHYALTEQIARLVAKIEAEEEELLADERQILDRLPAGERDA
ncbi:MAG TPA: hypothetical protein VFL91_00685 [Thermomicrobiales bacterium]|nr:hypothetical protein [Thermomicrobiales bacterium]